MKAARKAFAPKRKPRLPQERTRISARSQAIPPPSYTEVTVVIDNEMADNMAKIESEKTRGYRLNDGRWRGEMFGEVAGLKCGAVFGRGDFQREGRKEMMETGIFRLCRLGLELVRVVG